MMLPEERAGIARAAQADWLKTAIRTRLRCIARLRELIAREGMALAQAAGKPRNRPVAETLTAEVIPLAAACAFLEKNAARILRPRRLGSNGRPVWLSGVCSEIRREPFGVVLIVGPANYPLFLPGVQALQSLVAGNAVLLKPGHDGAPAAAALARLAKEAGLPEGLLQVLPEPSEEVYSALESGVDFIVFTGSSEAGHQVLAAAANRLVPAIVELSGEDPFLVRADANGALAARALRFGRSLNGGDSCIAPRRVYAVGNQASALRADCDGCAVLPVENDEAALHAAGSSAYGLGASIISGDEQAARALAGRVNAGVVVINDCIMPTADPA
ncbi:MAG: aldehyde dehydrogenase family protein, partial [Verrucomicrobiota bacterium]